MSAAPNYQIAGQLPFGGGGASLGSAIGGGVGDAYTSSYNAALAQNQAQYQNILGGYQQLQSNLSGALPGIQAGYGNLGNQIQNTISGIGASQGQSIKDVYAQQSGQAVQDLTNRGLGNSTVASSVQRGLTLDEQKAQTGLANQLAQLSAGYQANIGMAGLGFQNQALQQQQQLGQNQLGFMNSVNMQYPNAQSYQQLLQYQGANQQYQDFMKQHPVTGAGVNQPGTQIPVPPPSAPPPPQAPQFGGGGGISPMYIASGGGGANPFGAGQGIQAAMGSYDTGVSSGYNPATAQQDLQGLTPGYDPYGDSGYGTSAYGDQSYNAYDPSSYVNSWVDPYAGATGMDASGAYYFGDQGYDFGY